MHYCHLEDEIGTAQLGVIAPVLLEMILFYLKGQALSFWSKRTQVLSCKVLIGHWMHQSDAANPSWPWIYDSMYILPMLVESHCIPLTHHSAEPHRLRAFHLAAWHRIALTGALVKPDNLPFSVSNLRLFPLQHRGHNHKY